MKKITAIELTRLLKLLCFLILFAGLPILSWSQVSLPSAKISLGFKDADILSVINQVSEKTRLKFSYNKEDLDNSKKINIDAKERSVQDLLSLVGQQSELVFRIDKDIVLVKPIERKTASVAPKSLVDITGIIRSTMGDPLSGVSVKVKNSSLGTATDNNGRFVLNNIADNAILEVSLISYESIEEPVRGRNTIAIVLQSFSKTMDQLVVVGYGTQRKKDIIGAVSSVNTKNLEKLTGANVAGLLQGQVAGVNAAPGSGDPGAAPIVLVRGLSTINNNEPLYVIDGIPGDVNAVNPSDIQSIDVLKDASAATIYGSRASNGVIIVTTKRGREGKIRIGLNSYYGISKLSDPLPLADRVQYNTILKQAAANDGITPMDFVSSDTYTDVNGQTKTYPNTDWQNEFFRTAPENKIDVSVYGGSKDMKMNVSFGRYTQDGIAINTNFERYNLQVNSDFTKGKFKFGESFAYSQSKRRLLEGSNESQAKGRSAGYPLIYEMLNRVPHHPLYDPNNDGGFGGSIGSMMTDAVNPVGYQTLVNSSDESFYFIGNIFGEYEIIPSLSFKLQYGLNSRDGYSYTHMPTYFMGAKVNNPTAQLNESRDRSFHDVLNAVFTFNKTFSQLHSINAIAGYSQEQDKYKSLSGGNNNLPSNELLSLFGGIGDRSASGSLFESSLRSLFARTNYSYDGKYLFAATIRRDGSSRFSQQNKYGTFYSFSGGWRISRENFFANSIKGISDLKLRASYGILGNQSIADYQYLPATISVGNGNGNLNYPFGTGLRQKIAIGAIITGASSPDIRWEQSATFNAGFDLSVMNEKFLVIFDYFRTRTKDMLVQIPLPPSSGLLSNPTRNGGELENQGFDLAITYRKSGGDLKFDLTGNISLSKNKILKLGFADESFTDGYMDYKNYPTTLTEVGGSVGRFFLYKTNGIIKTQKELDDILPLQPNAKLGDVKFADTNGDGELNDDDRVYMGSGLPKFEYGLATNVTYKNFDLNIFFQGTQGNKMYNGAKRLMYQNTIFNKSSDLLNAWTPSNPGSDIPRVTIRDENGNMARPSDMFLENGSYLRLKSMQLGYRFTLKNINTLRAYIGATNVFTITKYTGYDPGIVGYSSFARGADRGLYPLSKSFFAGINLDF